MLEVSSLGGSEFLDRRSDQTVLHTLVNVCGFSCGFLCTVGRYNHKRISDSGALGDLRVGRQFINFSWHLSVN